MTEEQKTHDAACWNILKTVLNDESGITAEEKILFEVFRSVLTDIDGKATAYMIKEGMVSPS